MTSFLSPLAEQVGRYMAEKCHDGLPGRFGDDLLDAFPGEGSQAIRMALAELEGEQLVTLVPVMGPKLPRVRTTLDLFLAADPAITGHDPREDSVVLAHMLIEKPKLGGNAANLEEASGWDRRRFNPAFALLIPSVQDGRVRKTVTSDYPTLGLIVDDADVVALRRYVAHYG